MKMYLLLVVFALCAVAESMTAQTIETNNFIRKYKKKDNTTKFSLPGWVIDLGAGIGKGFVETEEEKEALKLLKKVQKMKIMVMEDTNMVSQHDVRSLVKSLKKNNFEPLLSIRDGSTHINILLREKKDKLKNLMILVSEEDEFVLLSLKTKIKLEDINQLLHLLESDYDLDLLPPPNNNDEAEDTPMIRA